MEFIDRNEYKNKFGIYGIKNIDTGKVYVGQTRQTFNRRFLLHNWQLKNNVHENQYLQKSYNKYGDSKFEFFIIEIIKNKNLDILNELEIKYIKKYKSQNLSYNILNGGGGRLGISMSENAKKIIGEKNRIHMLGRKASDETKRKMSESRKGKTIIRKTDILNIELAIEIKKRLMSGEKPSLIARDLGVSYKSVNGILSCNSWKNAIVDGWDYWQEHRDKSTRLQFKDHVEIYRLYSEDNFSKKEIAIMYNKNPETIRKIIKKFQNN